MSKVSAIIANYNTKDVLLECVANLVEVKKSLDIEIIVVDNGSPDGSAEAVYAAFPNEIILVRSTNKGISSAYNLGFEKSTGEYVMYLGTDAFPKTQDIIKLCTFLYEHEDAGIVTPKLILRDGSLDMDAHRGFPTPWSALTNFSGLSKIFPTSKLFNQYFLGYKDFTKTHEIDLCISHFMLVKRAVHTKIGKWDEDYFVYGEDVDFCYRAKQAGFKIYYISEVEVLHYKGVSVGRKESKDISKVSVDTKVKMIKQSTLAMSLFYKKHYVSKYPAWLTGLVILGISLLEKLRVQSFLLKNR